MNLVPAGAYHFCLALPTSFTQPGDHLLAKPCRGEALPARLLDRQQATMMRTVRCCFVWKMRRLPCQNTKSKCTDRTKGCCKVARYVFLLLLHFNSLSCLAVACSLNNNVILVVDPCVRMPFPTLHSYRNGNDDDAPLWSLCIQR